MNWIVLWDHLWEVIFYLFCFAAFVQVFYYSFFYSRVAFYREKTKQQSQQHPVSVIICAKDETRTLPVIFQVFWCKNTQVRTR